MKNLPIIIAGAGGIVKRIFSKRNRAKKSQEAEPAS